MTRATWSAVGLAIDSLFVAAVRPLFPQQTGASDAVQELRH